MKKLKRRDILNLRSLESHWNEDIRGDMNGGVTNQIFRNEASRIFEAFCNEGPQKTVPVKHDEEEKHGMISIDFGTLG